MVNLDPLGSADGRCDVRLPVAERHPASRTRPARRLPATAKGVAVPVQAMRVRSAYQPRPSSWIASSRHVCPAILKVSPSSRETLNSSLSPSHTDNLHLWLGPVVAGNRADRLPANADSVMVT